jgi:chromosome segregation ATPase
MSDEEMKAQLRSGLGNADKDADGLREKAYQVYINEVTPNGNSRMDNITTCAGPNEGHQRHIATQVDMAFQAGWSAAARIEALTAERDMAIEGRAEATRLIDVARQQYGAEKSRAEALTEQLEAARADAKEAEAYAEELEAKNGNLCDLAVNEHGRAERAEAKLSKAVEALRDLTNAFAKKVDVDQTRWKTPYEHPLSAYDRAVAFLKGDKP